MRLHIFKHAKKRGDVLTKNYRKLVFAFLIVFYLILYALLFMNIYAWIGRLPLLLELAFFTIAGIAWVFPLKPVLRWVSRGEPVKSNEFNQRS
ncbi:MAG: DUF2842 domain-containing protein [Alphaproteobacteria bacterium]